MICLKRCEATAFYLMVSSTIQCIVSNGKQCIIHKQQQQQEMINDPITIVMTAMAYKVVDAEIRLKKVSVVNLPPYV